MGYLSFHHFLVLPLGILQRVVSSQSPHPLLREGLVVVVIGIACDGWVGGWGMGR